MSNRRRFLSHLAAAGLLGSSAVLQRVLASGVDPVPPGLHKVTGDVRVNGRPARQGQLLEVNDLIETGTDGEATYVIGRDAYLQRANSRIQFSGDGAVLRAMRVLTGRILSVFGRGEKTLTVPTATIGIRGTGCYIEAEADRTYFCLCYGSAEVVPKADPSAREVITTTHHDHPIWIDQRPGMPTMSAAGVQNHGDAELTLLENLTGRWPPFHGSQVIGY